jgi:hypothetical protein
MFAKRSETIVKHLGEEIQLGTSTASLATAYREAKPFPHLVLHDLFPQKRLDDLVREIASIREDGWVIHEDPQLSKANLRSAVDLGESGKRHVALLHSAEFLYMISEITGIWGLVPDPYLAGSGYHLLGSGDVFDVHADRSLDHNTGLTRRVAMITYLNHDWLPNYGGQLELWSTDATHCERVVEPSFNTTIIFEVGDHNFHGVRPVETPKGLARKSFATYFHTVGGATGVTTTPHHSVYAPSVYHRPYNAKTIMSEFIMPPGIVKAFRKLRVKMGGSTTFHP